MTDFVYAPGLSTGGTGGSSVSSSYALTASYASTTSGIISNATSASYATTASYAVSASWASQSLSASVAVSASWAPGGVTSGVFGGNFSGSFSGSLTGSHTGTLIGTASNATTAYFASSSNYATNANSASYALSASAAISSSYATTAATASLLLGAVVSASYATTSSYSTTASFALTSAGTITNASTASYVLASNVQPGTYPSGAYNYVALAGSVPVLTLTPTATQSAPTLMINNSSGTMAMQVDETGSLIVSGVFIAAATPITLPGGTAGTYGAWIEHGLYIGNPGVGITSAGGLTVNAGISANGSGRLAGSYQIDNGITVGGPIANQNGGVNQVQVSQPVATQTNTGQTALMVRGSASSSANLTSWLNNASASVASISSSGDLVLNHTGSYVLLNDLYTASGSYLQFTSGTLTVTASVAISASYASTSSYSAFVNVQSGSASHMLFPAILTAGPSAQGFWFFDPNSMSLAVSLPTHSIGQNFNVRNVGISGTLTVLDTNRVSQSALSPGMYSTFVDDGQKWWAY